LLDIKIDQWDTLKCRIPEANGVERYIDTPSTADNRFKMLLDSFLVEGVHLSSFDGGAIARERPGYRLHRREMAARQEKLSPLPGKGLRDRTSNGTSSAVDHSNLVFQHHVPFPLFLGIMARVSVPRILCGTHRLL
jgi:hypothetical protein